MTTRRASFQVLLTSGACLFAPFAASAQVVERLSVATNGAQADGETQAWGASSDGRFVLMATGATNLVPVDTNGSNWDVVLRDRVAQTTTLVSLDLSGAQFGSGWESKPAISADGSTLVYSGTVASQQYLFAFDRVSGTRTVLHSLPNWPEYYEQTALSADGRLVAFYTSDTAHDQDRIYVHNRNTGSTVQHVLAVGSAGVSTAQLALGAMSADGRYFTYRHQDISNLWPSFDEHRRFDRLTGSFVTLGNASNLFYDHAPIGLSDDARYVAYWVATGTPGAFLRDVQAGTTELISVTLNGSSDTTQEDSGVVSAIGRWVAFASSSPALVAGDTNGVADIFVRDRQAGSTARVSVGPGGAQANGPSGRVVWMSPNATSFVFTSGATNLVPGDTNAAKDVFAVELCQPCFADLDGDGYGAGASQVICPPIPSGWSTVAGDCDDADPARHPGATELCNGIDEDCDSLIDEGLSGAPYCTSSTTPAGCTPLISATGCPSVAQASGFVVRVDGSNGARSGLILYGAGQASIALAFGNPSILCIAAPRQRMTAQPTGGTAGQCNGVLATDFLAWTSAHPGALHTPLVAGQALNFQGWIREPAFPKGSVLTGGWNVTLDP